MVQHTSFFYYYLLSKIRKKTVSRENVRTFFEKHTHYGNSIVYSVSDINKTLNELIAGNKPFMAGRFGAVELSALKTFDFEVTSKYTKNLEQMRNCAGFFPKNPDALKVFCDLMINCIPQVDIIGVWGQPFEDYYMKKFGDEHLKAAFLFDLEPWSYPANPWSAALKNKTVLVIHPFADTIKKQYEKRDLIYPKTEILPKFDLKVFKAVQTIAGERDERFTDWFQALNWMYEEVMKIDFDIAIIGCGAYGFPLAAKIKEAGKQAIHLGGATQLLFGIKGKRWETDSLYAYVQKYFNDAWVYPNEAEKPKRANMVEGGCYW